MTQTAEQRRLVRIAAGYNKKARQLGVPGTIHPVELAAKPPQCWYCKTGLEVGQGTYDHVIPFGRPHCTNDDRNIVRCCLSCNRRKFTKLPEEFYASARLTVECKVCGKQFTPRWGEYQRGMGLTCSRSCAARSRWSGRGDGPTSGSR